MKSELAGAYRTFFKSELGKDLVARIDAIYVKQLKSATKASKDGSWGLLNQAAGVELVRDEFKKVQLMDTKGGGRA